ncbi:uncharacterized protein [Henckelia pumila]|uniref:uncharacterized protein n=1 Tax=Henckelia pumila TaxID=405737 RepID=UPI003C6E1E72
MASSSLGAAAAADLSQHHRSSPATSSGVALPLGESSVLLPRFLGSISAYSNSFSLISSNSGFHFLLHSSLPATSLFRQNFPPGELLEFITLSSARFQRPSFPPFMIFHGLDEEYFIEIAGQDYRVVCDAGTTHPSDHDSLPQKFILAL